MVEHVAQFWVFYLVVLAVSLVSALTLALRLSTIRHRYHLMMTNELPRERFIEELTWLLRYTFTGEEAGGKDDASGGK